MVTILNLGGTIDLTFANGVPAQGQLRSLIPNDAGVIDLRPVQSNDLDWRHLLALRRRLIDRKAGADRFLVTVGTDALEEVAYFATLVRPPGTAVAVVGALQAPEIPGSDAGPSLARAWEWLRDDASQGVTVCIGGENLNAGIVEKVFVDGWRIRPCDQVGSLLPEWSLDPRARLTGTAPSVPILTAGISCDKWIAEILLGSHPDGVVLCGYGAGDFPKALVSSITSLVAREIPVVLASRSRPGRVEPLFEGIPGASHDLLQAGALGAGALNGALARVRLMIARAARPNVPVERAFEQSLW
jgi:L-asparaginase